MCCLLQVLKPTSNIERIFGALRFAKHLTLSCQLYADGLIKPYFLSTGSFCENGSVALTGRATDCWSAENVMIDWNDELRLSNKVDWLRLHPATMPDSVNYVEPLWFPEEFSRRGVVVRRNFLFRHARFAYIIIQAPVHKLEIEDHLCAGDNYSAAKRNTSSLLNTRDS